MLRPKSCSLGRPPRLRRAFARAGRPPLPTVPGCRGCPSVRLKRPRSRAAKSAGSATVSDRLSLGQFRVVHRQGPGPQHPYVGLAGGLHGQGLHERRLGRGRKLRALRLELNRFPAVQSEVEGQVRDARIDRAAPFVVADAPDPEVEGPHPVAAVADRQRVAEAGPDPRVRQVLVAVGEAHHERHVVPPIAVALGLAGHAPEDAAHVEAHGLQGVSECPVVLVAVAAASAQHELREQRVDVEPDGPAELDVEVLVRHRGDVGTVDPAQRVQRRASRGVDADALQVGAELRRVEHPSTIARDAVPGRRRDRTDTGMMLRG